MNCQISKGGGGQIQGVRTVGSETEHVLGAHIVRNRWFLAFAEPPPSGCSGSSIRRTREGPSCSASQRTSPGTCFRSISRKAVSPLNGLGDVPLNQRIVLAQLDVASCGFHKRLELLNRVLPLKLYLLYLPYVRGTSH